MPKGVMVSHGNLLHNSKVINMGFEDTPQSRGISWLPLHHDMGLIGGMLQPLYVGAPMTFLAPVAFLQRPYRWLQAISKYQATTSGGPNFAYDLCVQKVKPEQLANLDLSHWQVAFVGAEPIRAATLDRFAEKFAPCGFRREAFYASYGLAEATLFVTGGAKTIEPKVQSVQGMALERNEIHLPDSTPTPPVDTAQTDGIRTLVGVGSSKLDQTVRIVDPQTSQPCAAHQVGEIWVTGSSVAQGYWNAPQATAETFQAYLTTGEGPFLRTGDLGFLQGDELFITGRLKDAIIIRGRNHYPQDIEDTVQSSHPALKPDCSAAFVLEQDQKEQLVVVQEVDRNHLRQLNSHEVIRSIRRAVADHHGLQVHETVLIRPGSIPKTSSGKVRRRACRDAFLSGDLRVVV
jgi:acyl-CoA synthetase (AMP-forming)/AMP-acid ligase II